MPAEIRQTFLVEFTPDVAGRKFIVRSRGTAFNQISLSIRGLEELKELSRTVQKFLVEQGLQEGASS